MRSLNPSRTVPALMTGLCLLAGDAAAVVMLYDNTSAAPSTTSSFNNTTWYAQSFTTTATESVVTDISVRIRNTGGATGTFTLAIYDSTGLNVPGSQVALVTDSLNAATLSTVSLGGFIDLEDLAITLEPSTTYWLLARGNNLSTSIASLQSGANVNPGVADSLRGLSSNSGVTWAFSTTAKWNMSVAATAIPEPSAYAATLGLLGFAVAWRLRSRSTGRQRGVKYQVDETTTGPGQRGDR